MNYYDELKCPLCKAAYNEEENLPRLLINCGHTLCSKCLNETLSANNNCITCQEDNTKYENVTINSFPKNITLIKLIQKTSQIISSPKRTTKSMIMESIKKATTQSQKKAPKFCPLHQNRNLEIICLDDKCKICTNCALFGTHKNHNVMNLEDFEKDIEMKSELLIDLFDLVDQSFKPSDSSDSKINNSKEKFDSLLSKIDDKSGEISLIVTSFTSELINKIKTDEKKLMDSINEKFSVLKDKISYYKSFPSKLNQRVDEWKNKVQDKLNILNEITDIDEQCLMLIDNNETNGYNYLIEQGDTIMNDLDKINAFPIDEIEKEVSNANIQIQTKVLSQEFFNLENEIDFSKLVHKVSLVSTNKTLTNSRTISYFKDDTSVSQFPTISDIKFPEEFELNDNIDNRRSGNGNSTLSYDNVTAKIGSLSNSFLNLSEDNIINEHNVTNNNINAKKNKTNTTLLDFECLPRSQSKNAKSKNKTPPNTSRTKTPDKDKFVFIKTQFKKEIVNLSRYDIGDEGAKFVAETLTASKIKIKELKLTKCNISDVGASHLFKALEGNSTVSTFNIGGNQLTNKSVEGVVNLLKKNNSIKTLYLTNNEFTVLAKEKIRSYNGSNGTKAIKIFI